MKELFDGEYAIPEGYTASIENGKIIVKKEENEDESIRKYLSSFVELNSGVNLPPEEAKKILAWLEKQGEQKQPTKYTLEQAAHIFLDALSNTPYNNKPVTDAQVITMELLKFLSDAHSYNPNAINKQNPSWSEEDERMYKAISIALSLKDAKGYLGSWYKTPEDADDWLKSLKYRRIWKPSDEQIEAIRLARSFVTDDFSDNPTLSEILIELENQLKKLMEE